jgi:hypothetical protein
MTTSINQPWAVTDKFRVRYGDLWADLDFVMHPKISEENFKAEPMSTTMGDLHIAGQQITMRYKDLLAYAKSLDTLSSNLYAERVGKTEKFEVSIKGREFMLTKHEIGKLCETMHDAASAAMRGYEIGLYL